jgi:hypothetical protein
VSLETPPLGASGDRVPVDPAPRCSLDDLPLRADAHRVDLAGLPMMGVLMRRVGAGRLPLRLARMAVAL